MTAPDDASLTPSDDETALPACVLVFNANDPSGAGGLTADVTVIASVGGHPAAVVTGAYARDTGNVFDHFHFDDEAVAEQARAVLEDLPIQAIKVGFVGSPATLGVIAQIADDYAEAPVIAYMPSLNWWHDDLIDQYLDAFAELLLPQASVLVGSHGTLWRWLLPDWSSERSPSARDIATAAAQHGTPYVLVTGIPADGQCVENVLASPEAVLGSGKFELFEATFTGAGDTLSAALAALIASGNDLGEATAEALAFLDQSLAAGYRPGMGHVLPDRMFWAHAEDDEEAAEPDPFDGMPPHDTKH